LIFVDEYIGEDYENEDNDGCYDTASDADSAGSSWGLEYVFLAMRWRSGVDAILKFGNLLVV